MELFPSHTPLFLPKSLRPEEGAYALYVPCWHRNFVSGYCHFTSLTLPKKSWDEGRLPPSYLTSVQERRPWYLLLHESLRLPLRSLCHNPGLDSSLLRIPASQINYHLQEGRLPVLIFGTAVLFGALAALSLPETTHKPVPRDIADTEKGSYSKVLRISLPSEALKGPLMSLLMRDRRYKMQTSWTTQSLLSQNSETTGKWEANVA